MNLFIFPEAACLSNGYGIGVEYAYQKLQPKEGDVVVWYTDLPKERMLHLKESDFVLKKNKFLSFRSCINIMMGKDRTEPHYGDLSFLSKFDFDEIHLDESFFYRPLRRMYPKKKMSIRFHNCFARIYDRQKLMQTKLDWKYLTKLKNMYQLEREIFQDKNVYKIFISDEDRDYYRNNFGVSSDSETWPYIPNMNKAVSNRKEITFDHRVIWYGGIESHKTAAINWFVQEVFPQIRKAVPDVEFHLWGKGSSAFNNPSENIIGHGFFDGDGMPSYTSLYINPDIIGGGIKLKLQTLIEAGVPFISSVFGYEGYSKSLIDNRYIIVEEDTHWAEKIIKIIK